MLYIKEMCQNKVKLTWGYIDIERNIGIHKDLKIHNHTGSIYDIKVIDS